MARVTPYGRQQRRRRRRSGKFRVSTRTVPLHTALVFHSKLNNHQSYHKRRFYFPTVRLFCSVQREWIRWNINAFIFENVMVTE